ncbi:MULTISPECIES: DUF6386 family protein [unclassified Microcoleus]|uniref:DUF6386 family protein n=1 Tax=unclassified Microcoleus TaxID=2642155 RepID=UPI002FD0D345
MLDEKRVVGTEIATWFLFHPDDLAHRLQNPEEWCWHEFAISKEFASGNLVAITTGADGAFLIRFTDQNLTEQEQLHVLASVTFRLCVRNNCLYLDGGDLLPSAQMFGYHDATSWLEIPNGNYQVIVHTFDCKKCSNDANLPSYTVQFQPVVTIDTLDSPTLIPRLIYAKGLFEQSDPRQEWRQSITSTLESEYALMQWPEMIFPSFNTKLLIDRNQCQNLKLIRYRYTKSSHYREFEIVIGHALEPQAIGTLFQVTSYGQHYDQFDLSGIGKKLVQLIRIFERDDLWWAEVEPFQPPTVATDSSSLDHLKRLFAHYAETNANYPQLVEYPQFYAERIASLSVPRELGWAIAYALDLTPEVKRSLLIMMSDQDLVQQLSKILELKSQ